MSPHCQREFEKIFDDNYRRMLNHARRFIPDECDAEDIVADVFYELWKRIETLDLERGISTYLYQAVSSRALNYLRHKNIAAVRIETLQAINEKRMEFIAKENTEDEVHSREISQGIMAAMKELPEKCRQVFSLSYISGLKSKEIADALGLSVRTVEAHIYKALRIMRDKLGYLVPVLLLFYLFTK